jgi:hypothetical protein
MRSHFKGATIVQVTRITMFKTVKMAKGSKASLTRIVTRRNFFAFACTVLIRQVLEYKAANVIEKPTENRYLSSMHATSSSRWGKGSWKVEGMIEEAMMNDPAESMTRNMGWLALTTGVFLRMIVQMVQ